MLQNAAAGALAGALLIATLACTTAPPPTEPPPTAAPTASPSPSPSPTPSPSPAPTASPSPSPSPVNVVDEFLRRITAQQSIEAMIGGLLTVGAVELELFGSYQAAGSGDSYTVLQMFVPDGSVRMSETLVVGLERYEARDGGPFVPGEPLDDSPRQQSLAAFLRALAGLTDRGRVTYDGRSLHHLVPPTDVALDPAVLGLQGEQYADAAAAVEFYAELDGTPAVMVAQARWTQSTPVGQVPALLYYEISFLDFGGPVELAAPADIWQRYVSETQLVSVAHPADWTVTSSAGYDAIDSPYGDRLLFVSAAGSGSLVTETEGFIAGLRSEVPGAVDTIEDMTIDGQPAKLISLTPNDGNFRIYAATVVKDGRFYTISLFYQDDEDGLGMGVLYDFLTTVTFLG